MSRDQLLTDGPDRPIFVVGCPRSGTTLFRTMLHAHPRIAIPPETRYLIPAYHRRASFGDLRKPDRRRRLAEWITDRKDSRFRALRLDRDTVVEAIVAGPPTLGSALGTVYQLYAEKHGRSRWGDKRPAYYSYLAELDRLFPDAQFIHLVRDARACVSSLRAVPWFSDDLAECTATWMHAVTSCRRAGRSLGPDRYFELRYEDLVADPERELAAVCRFLGEDYDPAMAHPERIAGKVNPKYYEQRAQIQQGVYAKSLDSWRAKLPPADIAVIDKAAARLLGRYGYERSGVATTAPTGEVARTFRLFTRYQRWLVQRRVTDRRRSALEQRPVAAELTSGQRRLAAAPAEPTLVDRAWQTQDRLTRAATRTLRRARS